MGNTTSLIAPCKPDMSCSVKFDEFNTTVLSIGGIDRGSFQGDQDIAGLGTIIAFFLPTLGLLITGLIIILSLMKTSVPKDSTGWIIEMFDRLPLPAPDPPHPFAGPPRHRPLRRVPSPFATPPEPRGHAHGPPAHGHPVVGQGFDVYPQFAMTQPSHQLMPQNYPQYNHEHDMESQYPSNGSIIPPTPAKNTSQTSVSTQDDRPTISIRRVLPSATTWYDLFEAALLCVPDSQLLLAIALFSYFYIVSGLCDMSHYHLQIGINLALLACTNFVLSFALVRNYWKSPSAAFVRVVCAFLVLGGLGVIFDARRRRGYTAELLPSRKDSLMLLNAGCFLDDGHKEDLQRLAATNGTGQLVGGLNQGVLSSQDAVFWMVLVGATSAILLFHIFRFIRRKLSGRTGSEGGDGNEHTAPAPKLFLAWAFILFVALLVLTCMTVASTARNREWVRRSGWMADDTEEESVKSFGQFAALMAMVTVMIAMFDKIVRHS